MNRQVILRWLTSLAVITMLQWSSILHAQDSCQPVFDALDKVFTTPSHSYSTYTVQGRTIIGEKIYTQGKAFDRGDGKWMKDSDDPKTLLAKEIENRKQGAATCKIVGEESVNGQPAVLYSLHGKTQHITEEVQMWIAKGTGLLLREEMIFTEAEARGRATCPAAMSTGISNRRCSEGATHTRSGVHQEVFSMASFCVKCGSPLTNGPFCTKCGTDARTAAQSAQPQSAAMSAQPTPAAVPPAQTGPQPAAPPPAGQVVAQPAPARQGMSTLAKLGIAAVGIIFAGGVAGAVGVYYVAHRVSQKIHQAENRILGAKSDSGGDRSAPGDSASGGDSVVSSTDNSMGRCVPLSQQRRCEQGDWRGDHSHPEQRQWLLLHR